MSRFVLFDGSVIRVQGKWPGKRELLAVVALFLIAFLTRADEARGLDKSIFTLKDSILFATDNSPAFDDLRRNLQISEMNEKSAAFKMLPSLDLVAKNGISGSSPKDTDGYPSEFKLGLTESLYDNGASRTNHQIAVLDKSKSELEFQDKKSKLALDVATRFVDYSLKLKLLDIQERQLKLVKTQFEEVSNGYHQGLKTKRDFLRFKSYPIRREIDVAEAKNNAEISRQELLKAIGAKSESSGPKEFAPVNLDSTFDSLTELPSKIEDHLQYRIAVLEKKMNRLGVDLVRKKNLPEWLLTAGLSYSSSNYLGTQQNFSDNAKIGWEALLVVQYNFMDWGTRARDYEISVHKEMIKSNEIDTSLLGLQATLNQLNSRLENVRKSYHLAKEWVSIELANVEYIGREYRNGKVQYLDMITGLKDLSDAQNRFYTVSAEFHNVQYDLLYHKGSLYDLLVK
ncbi:MAG: TolC family protein [Bdellovibrionales bacterium]|nr:TolC family protein [Bdellovibrionales bacterium]